MLQRKNFLLGEGVAVPKERKLRLLEANSHINHVKENTIKFHCVSTDK